jgi:hypothetical protein
MVCGDTSVTLWSDYTQPDVATRLPRDNTATRQASHAQIPDPGTPRRLTEQDGVVVGPNEIFAIQENDQQPVVAQPQEPVEQNEGGAPAAAQQPAAQPTHRSTRGWRPTQRMLESMQQEDLNLSAALY